MFRFRNRVLMFLSVAVLSIAAPGRSASLAHDSPKEIVSKASKGVFELLEVTADIERFASGISDPREMFEFLLSLDKLDEIRKAHGMDAWGGNPVRKTALVLTREAIKWAHFDAIPPNVLSALIRWASDDTRYALLGEQNTRLKRAEKKADLLAWAAVVEGARRQVEAVKSQPYVINSYQEFEGIVIAKLLKMWDQLTETEATGLIKRSNSVPALTELAHLLEEQTYDLKDAGKTKRAWERSLVFAEVVRSQVRPLPAYLRNAPGVVTSALLERILLAGDAPDKKEVDAIMQILSSRQQTELAALMIHLHQRGIVDEQRDFLWTLLTRLLDRYTAMGLEHQIQDIRRILPELRMMALRKEGKMEGRYDVTVAGKPATLTLARLVPGSFILGLSAPESPHVIFYYSFLSVAYESKDDSFIASRFPIIDSTAGLPPTDRNFTMRFKVKNGGFGGIMNARRDHNAPVVGRLTETFKDYWSMPGIPAEDLSGNYSGLTPKGKELRLVLHQQGANLRASVLYDSYDIAVHFNIGTVNKRNNAFYLNTTELESGQWIQLRGQVQNRVMHLQYILGGHGARFGEVVLRKH